MTTNRALDPSLEGMVAGTSASATLYPVADDPAVKFAGTRSKRTTRQGANSNTVGAVTMSPTTFASAAKIAAAPGDVLSLSAKALYLAPCRLRLDVSFRDASNVTLGAVAVGPYVDAPNPDWATATNENLTAPANTAFVYATLGVYLPAGGVTVGGEVAWFDALMVNDGPVALPYFDGSTPDDGYVEHRWTGPVNNSTSTELPAVASPVRQKIAAAASIPGVRVAPNFRQTIKVGDGMVRLNRVDFPNRLGGVTSWQVLIVLPTDIAAAERWLDTKIPALREAVGAELTVASIVPQELVTDAGKVPVVVLTGNRETE